MFGNTFVSLRGARERRAAFHGLSHDHDRVLDDRVAGGSRRYLEAVEDGDAGGDQRGKRSGEARHGDFAAQLTDDRKFQYQPVDDPASSVRRVVGAERQRARNAEDEIGRIKRLNQ